MTDVERELLRRLSAGYILEPFAEKIRRAADCHPTKDYRALEHLVLHPPVPAVLYHWAPVEARESIGSVGLLPADPGAGRFASEAFDQPAGVYGASVADDWREPGYELWSITTEGLPWNNDPGSGDSWYCPQPVPPGHLSLVTTDEFA